MRSRRAVAYEFTHVCTVSTVTQTCVPELPGDPELAPELPVPELPEPELPEPELPALVPELPVPELPEPEPEDPLGDPELVPEPELVVLRLVAELADPPEVPGEPAESAAEVVSVPPRVPEPAPRDSADVDPAEAVPVWPETKPARAALGAATAGRRCAADAPSFAGGRELGGVPVPHEPAAAPPGGLALWPTFGADEAGPAANPPIRGV
jgi:hypothetical protein